MEKSKPMSMTQEKKIREYLSKQEGRYKGPPSLEEPPTPEYVLQRPIHSCPTCGIIFDFELIKRHQYDYELRRQRVICPICRETIWEE